MELLKTPQQSHCLMTVVSRGVSKNAAIILVTAVDSKRVGFRSTIFLVPKKESGQMRPVVKLKPLNRFSLRVHFKMEGVHMVCDQLQKVAESSNLVCVSYGVQRCSSLLASCLA